MRVQSNCQFKSLCLFFSFSCWENFTRTFRQRTISAPKRAYWRSCPVTHSHPQTHTRTHRLHKHTSVYAHTIIIMLRTMTHCAISTPAYVTAAGVWSDGIATCGFCMAVVSARGTFINIWYRDKTSKKKRHKHSSSISIKTTHGEILRLKVIEACINSSLWLPYWNFK